MKLTSYEQRLLATFILQSDQRRKEILADARASAKVSGPLILAYEWAMKL
jgi:hypothetical protein